MGLRLNKSEVVINGSERLRRHGFRLFRALGQNMFNLIPIRLDLLVSLPELDVNTPSACPLTLS